MLLAVLYEFNKSEGKYISYEDGVNRQFLSCAGGALTGTK
jgi:hypothetical protein